jgi:hypothetical protein
LSASPSSISFTWPPVTGATSYNVYEASKTDVLLGSTVVPPITITGLSSNTAYGLVVAANNGLGTGPLSKAATAYTLSAEPSNLQPKAVFLTSATFSWSSGGNVDGTQYVVSHWIAGKSTAASVAVTTTSATITGLVANTAYTFGVAALSPHGADTPLDSSVEASTRTLPLAPKSPPAKFAVVGASTNAVTFSWAAVTGEDAASSYLLYFSTFFSMPVEATGTSLTYGGLLPNTTESARVQAVNASGASKLSAGATGYSMAAAPTGLNLSGVYLTTATLYWQTNGNPTYTHYALWRYDLTKKGTTSSTTTISILPEVIDVDSAAYTVTGLSQATTYFFHIQAVNGAGKTGLLSPTEPDPTVVSSATTWKLIDKAAVPDALKYKTVVVTAGAAYGGKTLTLQNAPNPFNLGAATQTVLVIDLPVGTNGLGKIKIVSRAGAVVNEFDLGLLKGGFTYYAAWNGQDGKGSTVPPGIYHGIFWMPGLAKTASDKITVLGTVGAAKPRR